MQLPLSDSFKINIKFWKFLGISPANNLSRYYSFYSKLFILIGVILYDLLFTINFYFIPRQLDLFIGEMIFYFTELAVASKVLTFTLMRHEIAKLLVILESDIFQPDTEETIIIIKKAKTFIERYYKIVAAVSVTSNLTHILSPIIAHMMIAIKLELPVCSYSFLSETFRDIFIYPLYFYQALGMHFHMWCNVNIDSFFLGLMILSIAQLEILNIKLRTVTDERNDAKRNENNSGKCYDNDIIKLNKNIIHYNEVGKFCELIQKVFSVTLFVQFGMASCIICVCLVRFTMPAPLDYYIFLATYMFVMIIQILVPCWYGTRIIDKSSSLSLAVYNCDWTATTKEFKSNMRIFVERVNKPLSITGGKMFPVSLTTFSSIMNSAYSFFTLLRHMQSRED